MSKGDPDNNYDGVIAAVGRLFRDNIGGIIAVVIAASVAYGVHSANIKWIDSRISQIEQTQPSKLVWQLEEAGKTIAAMQAEARSTQMKISSIEAQIGIINAKMDSMLKKLDQIETAVSRKPQ